MKKALSAVIRQGFVLLVQYFNLGQNKTSRWSRDEYAADVACWSKESLKALVIINAQAVKEIANIIVKSIIAASNRFLKTSIFINSSSASDMADLLYKKTLDPSQTGSSGTLKPDAPV